MIADGTRDCVNCQYFQQLGGDTGICHRHPPVFIAGGKPDDRCSWAQPHVQRHGWCGEFVKHPPSELERQVAGT